MVLSAKKFETSLRGIRFLEFVQQDEGVIIKMNAVYGFPLIIKRIRTSGVSIEGEPKFDEYLDVLTGTFLAA